MKTYMYYFLKLCRLYLDDMITYLKFLPWVVSFHAKYGFGIKVFHNPRKYICRKCWNHSQPFPLTYAHHFNVIYNETYQCWWCPAHALYVSGHLVGKYKS